MFQNSHRPPQGGRTLDPPYIDHKPSAVSQHGKCARFLLWLVIALLGTVCLPDPGQASFSNNYLLTAEPVTPVNGSFSSPVFASAAPGDTSALFVLEQYASRIRRFDLNTRMLSNFLDMTDVLPTAGGERGLLGMAFHPQYAANGKLYVHEFDGVNVNIYEFTHTAGSATVDLGTQRTILSFQHLGPLNHAAGWIGFSPLNGYLYVPTGDGGIAAGCLDCGLPAQDLNDLRGKLLRLDVSGDSFPADPLKNYAIPADNPFAQGGGAPEILAWGLRHPWRAGFDQLTGDLYIGDVGSNSYEEINLVPASATTGLNFGWRAVEGPDPTPQYADPVPPDAVDPLYYYPNDPGTSAVTGGLVYRGTGVPGLSGRYLFADYVKGMFSSFDPSGGTVQDLVNHTIDLGALDKITAFVEGPAGELFLLIRDNPAFYRLASQTRGVPEPAAFCLAAILAVRLLPARKLFRVAVRK